MSDVKKLSDVFKASSEVTSLESTDRVLAIDANGNPKRIRRDRIATPYVFFNDISTPQWVRIGKFTSSACALIKIFSIWNNIPGNNILVDMLLHPNNAQYNAATVLSRMRNAGNSLLPKLRVVRKHTSESYIDLYYNGNTAELVYIYLIHNQNVTLLTPEPDAQIPEGYTAVEFDISTVSLGGVKRYRLTTYAIMQKGGWRNGGNETTFRSNPERIVDGRDGRPRLLLRRGQYDDSRHISRERGRCHRDIAGFQFAGRLDIRHSGSDKREVAACHPTLDLRHWRRGHEDMAERMACLETVDTVASGKGVAA